MVMGLGLRGVPRLLLQYGGLGALPPKFWKYDVQICRFWRCILTTIKSVHLHGVMPECRYIWRIPNNFSLVLCKAVIRGCFGVWTPPKFQGKFDTQKPTYY